MIDRQHGHLVIECDCCDETYEGASADWEDVWPAAKENGWKARKIGGEWVHACPECRIDD